MHTNLSVLVLNGSLKHIQDTSTTQEVVEVVLEKMKEHATITSESIRLADKNIPVGLGFKESEEDEWPGIAHKIKDADIIIFATPIWWGAQSSLIQRIIERMDSFDEEFLKEGKSPLLNKVAGIVITGSEDGAQAVMSRLMSTLSFMNFTLPPQCCTYFVGEVGVDSTTNDEHRRSSEAVEQMAKETARSLTYYAKLLKEYPMQTSV